MATRERLALNRFAQWEAKAQADFATNAVERSIVEGLNPLRQIVGALPDLASTIGTGTVVEATAAGVAAFAAGFAIGTGAKYVLGKLGLFSSPSIPTVTGSRWVKQDPGVWMSGGPVMSAGWLWRYDLSNGSSNNTLYFPSGAVSATTHQTCVGAVSGPGTYQSMGTIAQCGPGQGNFDRGYSWEPITGTVGTTVFDGANPSGYRSYTAPNLADDATTDSAIGDALTGPSGAPLRGCLDYLAGDPTKATPVTGAVDPCGATQGADDGTGTPVSRPDPIDGIVVPSGACSAGSTLDACSGALTTDGLPAEQVTSTVAPSYDPSQPTGAIETTTPAVGSEVMPGTAVAVQTNPQPDGLFTVPMVEPDETYEHYIVRLQALGWVGKMTVTYPFDYNPSKPVHAILAFENQGSRNALTDDFSLTANPDNGNPQDNPTTVTPASTAITNWPGAEGPPLGDGGANGGPGGEAGGPSGGGCGPRSVRPIDPGALADIPHKFPFGIPFWIVTALGSLTGSSSAPTFDLTTPVGPLHVDLSFADDTVTLLRTLVLVVAAIGMLVSLANLLGRFWIDRRAAAG